MTERCSVCGEKAMPGASLCPACRSSYKLSNLTPRSVAVREVIEWAARRARKVGRASTLSAFQRKYGYRPVLEPKWFRGR